ncbi:catechol 1,2-dioxygenase [Fictibacillus nanhaiensis]|uniref:dioxygenase family protein n=1 Tax=Fictibacillus nanhaiensis TaxID=742169 RepID=UPI002040AEAF|nr:dioxygenase [Fictibacillus nanhaiensis]MCM3733829.1 catechol 1,2-dioxygenase [Fictibacillus nanhaiensis]
MASQRVLKVFEGIVKHTKKLLDEAQISHDEYHEFVLWLDRLGRKGEIPLFMDVFFETHVLNSIYSGYPGTEPSLLGPYHIENTPMLEEPYVLTQRADEKGDVLYFKGTVRSVDGKPLANTLVDMWQADADGEYSHYADDIPEYNLRGRFYTDENGQFEVKTIVPAPYKIPTNGPTGEFLDYIDHHPYRPAHLHIQFKQEGYENLITQVFFEGDPWIETDVAEGVRSTLITKLEHHEDTNGSYKTASLDFEMRTQNWRAETKKDLTVANSSK